MGKAKRVLLSLVSVMTIASLVTGCCCSFEVLGPGFESDEDASQQGTPITVFDEVNDSRRDAGGEYLIEHTEQTRRTTRVAYPYGTFSDFTAEVDVRFGADTDFTLGGLLFRWQDEHNHYGFLVWNDGQYGLFKMVNGEFEELINESSPYVNSGASVNRLKVSATGGIISVYVNDQNLTWINDSSFLEGKVGLHATVHSESPVSTQVYFDNLRIYEPDDPSTILLEDDFSDPTSGWPVQEYAYGSAGYLAGPGEVEVPRAPTGVPFERIEIVSQTEIDPAEFMSRVEGDQEFADVYTLASQQGYSDREIAGEFTMSDGTTLGTLVLRSPAGQRVVALRFAGADRQGSLLVRGEGETLILYDRDGRAELTTREQAIDIKVFDAAGNPIAETASSGWRPPALASAREQQGCTGGYWADFDHCCRQWVASGAVTTAGCVAAWGGLIVAIATGGWALPVAAAVFVAACPFAYYCMNVADVDNLPTYDLKLPDRVGTCDPECYAQDGREGVLTRPKYRTQVEVDDDRPRRPSSPQYIEACAGESGSLVIRDCAGHTVEVKEQAPDWQPNDWVECTGDAPFCSPDLAQCVECVWDVDCEEEEKCVGGACITAAPTILDFSAAPSAIGEGETSILSWSVAGDVTGVTLDGQSVQPTAPVEVRPTETQTYELRAVGPGGEDTKTTTVEVLVLGTGDLSFRLTWQGTADLDLHVIEPNGQRIWYQNPQSSTGGQLDVDDLCDPEAAGGPENIYWPEGEAPHGQYTIIVDYYEQCANEGSQGYAVYCFVDGEVKWSTEGIISPDQEKTIRTFNYPYGE